MLNRKVLVLSSAVFVGLASMAYGGPIAIAPTTIELTQSQSSSIIQVENADDSPVDLQFRAYGWSQEAGADQLTPTKQIIVSPAITTVAPHQRQTFRILRADLSQVDHERSYRLKLNQIPKSSQNGVGINLEFSLPVFVSDAHWRPRIRAFKRGGSLYLENTGPRRAKITSLAIQWPASRPFMLTVPTATYVLTGGQKVWAWPTSVSWAPGTRVVGQTDIGPLDVSIDSPQI